MLQFEIYDRRNSYGRGRKRAGKTVTVQARGLMSLNEEAYAELGSPQAVKFLVAKDEMLIGLEPCKPSDQNAYAVRTRQHVVSAITVLKYMGADLSRARRYELRVKDGLPPYIDLGEDAPVVTSNRKRSVP